jgi:uncharacterized protein YecT (DUF1311 family)
MAVLALAQKAPAKKADPCANAQNQNAMNACAQAEYKKAGAELNRVYQQLLAKLEFAHQEKLKAAQRAWLPFRDAHCEAEAFTFEGGSMQPMMRGHCLAAETQARTKQLQAMLKEMTSR